MQCNSRKTFAKSALVTASIVMILSSIEENNYLGHWTFLHSAYRVNVQITDDIYFNIPFPFILVELHLVYLVIITMTV